MVPSPAPRDGKMLVASPQERGRTQKAVSRMDDRQDFTLVLGGPLFQLLRRLYLSGDALELVRRRVLVITSIVWLPLIALSTFEGQAWGGNAAVPFLWDLEANIRVLVAVPLLIIAELIV